MTSHRGTLTLALILLAGGGCADTLPSAHRTVSYRTLLLTQHLREKLEKKYRGMPAVHLYRSDRLGHHYADEKWWFDHEHTLRYLLLAPRSGTFTTFTVTTKKGQVLAAVELVALYPSGKLRRFGRKHLHVAREDDGRVTYKFIYPHTTKGTVIHERHVLRWPDAHKERHRLFYKRIMLQSYLPVLEQRVVYHFPSNWSVVVKKPGLPLGKHLKWRYVGQHWQEIRYTRRNVPPLPPEPLTASPVRDGRYLAIQVQRMIHRKGSDSRPTKWEHVSIVLKKVYLEQALDARRYLAPVAQAIISGWRTPAARQAAIIRYVQRAFTIRSSVDWSIPNVLREVGGSPIQITALAYHMLRQVGIAVEFVMIHDAVDGVFDKTFVSLKELDSPALLLNVGGQGKLAFPWLHNVPIGLVPARFQGQTAMRISSAGQWKMYKTIQSKGATSTTTDRYRIRINSQGQAWVRATERYDGFAAVRLRNRLLAQSPTRRATYLAYRVRGPGQREPVRNTRVENLRLLHRPLALVSSYPMRGLWVRSPGERVLRLHPLSPGKKTVLRRLSRRYRPITITAKRVSSRRFEVRYPQSWRLVGAPKSAFYRNSFGSYRVTVTRKPSRIDIHQRLVFNRVRRPPSFASALQILQLEVTRLSGIHLTFRTKP